MRTTCTKRGSTLSTLSFWHIIFFASSTAAMSWGVIRIICKAMVCYSQKLTRAATVSSILCTLTAAHVPTWRSWHWRAKPKSDARLTVRVMASQYTSNLHPNASGQTIAYGASDMFSPAPIRGLMAQAVLMDAQVHGEL